MSSGIITLTKCDANLVGISIGGGAPLCPHVYIVQGRSLMGYDNKTVINKIICSLSP